MEPARNERAEWLKFAWKAAQGCLRQRQTRRQLMFYLTLATMSMAVFGVLIFAALARHPWLLVVYWGFCFGLVLLMLLMAGYDLLAVRGEHREELRRLRRKVFGQPKDQG